MTELFLLLLKPALLCVSNPRKYWYFAPLVFPAYLLDVILAHTVWAMLFGWPEKAEWTISDTLNRLVHDFTHPDNLLLIQVALKINRVCPNHIIL